MSLTPHRRHRPNAPRPARVGTVRVAGLRGLTASLCEMGVPLGPLLAEAGLEPTLFDTPDNLVEVGAAARLLELAAEKSRCPHLGLLCGQRFRPDTLGIVGQTAQNASDIGRSLRGLILNLHLHGHAFVPTLTVSAGVAQFGMTLASDLPGNTIPAVDLAMAAAFAILRALCGPTWTPTDVLLVHQPVASREPYDRLFGVRVQFGCDRNAITFMASWLERTVHGASVAKRALLERELAVITQQQTLPAATLARRALIACIAGGNASVEAVAAAMALHPRSLNRRLAQEGTSVFELLKTVRFQIARDLLENTSLSISEIASTLLYANIGAFTRAFRLWSKQSPSDWRMKRRNRKPVA